MDENLLNCCSMMLTEHLYQILIEYIVQGRSRAPPETELIEMLPTFQFGARTDRRALQSKFKSWARRLYLENGYLTLMNSGKIVIPREKCDNLVMYLHSDKHHNIDDVISAIRLKYTWKKKNFGMERIDVVKSILRNCKKEDCLKRMRMELAKLGTSFCAPSYEIKDFFPIRVPPPLPCIPPYSYKWPLPFPVPSVFPLPSFPFPIPLFRDAHKMRNSRVMPNEANSISKAKAGNVLSSKANHDHNVATFKPSDMTVTKLSKLSNETSKETPSIGKETLLKNPNVVDDNVVEMSMLAFKKPKNAIEYKVLMETVRQRPSEFPKILRMEKNQFLSVLGIAPKKICSSKTLKKFRREHRQKQIMNRACMIYRERKTLRDKNKLRKFPIQRKQLFLKTQKCKDNNTQTKYGLNPNEIKTSQISRFLNISRKTNASKHQESVLKRKRMKLSHIEKKEKIEVIDILSSSDNDEIDPKNDCSMVEDSRESKANGSLVTENNQLVRASNVLETDEISKKENLDQGGTTENIQERQLSPTEQLMSKKQDGTSYQVAALPTSNIENLNLVSGSEGQPDAVSETKVQKTFSATSKTKMYPNIVGDRITTATNHIQSAPQKKKTSSTCVTTNQNTQKVSVGPVDASQLSNTKVFLIDKGHEKYYVIPQYVLPVDLKKIENQQMLDPQGVPMTNGTKILNPRILQPNVLHSKNEKLREDIFSSEKMFRSGTQKININEEMSRISTWIYRMKTSLNLNMLNHNSESSIQKFLSQLDMGLFLVKKAKKSLMSIESSSGAHMSLKKNFY